MIRTLQDHTTYLGVTVHMEHTVIELILDGGRAAGVLAYDRERGRFHVFSAKAIVLATLFPASMAHMLDPFPRCSTIVLPAAALASKRGRVEAMYS